MKSEPIKPVIIELKRTDEGYVVRNRDTVFVLDTQRIGEVKEVPPPPTPTFTKGERNPNKKFNKVFNNMNPIIIPSSSVWFDIRSIHRIERESLPEFFGNSNTKDPDGYVKLRNSILALFYSQTNKYLTVTATLKVLVS